MAVPDAASRLGYTMGGDTLFVTVPDQEVAAIDAATGHVRWRFVPPSGGAGVGAFQDGVLYVSSLEDGIWALADDGDGYTVLWHDETPSGFTIALAGDTLYSVGTDGSLFAVGAGDGALLWEAEVSEGTSGPVMGPVVSGGMAFTVDQDGGRTVSAFAEPELIARLPDPVVAQPDPPAVAGLPDPFRVVRPHRWRRRASCSARTTLPARKARRASAWRSARMACCTSSTRRAW